MGHFKSKFGINRERSKMVLPSQFIYVIQQKGEGEMERFKQLCEKGIKSTKEVITKRLTFQLCIVSAFLVLRENGCLLVSLLSMTISSGMPELKSETDLEYMRTVLQLNDNISEDQALDNFRKDFNNSLDQSFAVKTNWWFHTTKQLCQNMNI